MHGPLEGVRTLLASHLPTTLPTSLHGSILFLEKESMSAASHCCPAPPSVGRIQPWGILKQISCSPGSPWLLVWDLDYRIGNS